MIKLPNIRGLAILGRAAIAAHRPEILFGTSIVTTVGAVVAAAKGGYDARGKVEAERMTRVASPEPPFDTFKEYHEQYVAQVPDLTVKEKIQLTWINYLPSAGLTAGALGATTGLHLVHIKEKKALAAAALMAIDEVKGQSKEYVDRVLEAVDGNVDDKTREAIRDDALDPNKTGGTKVLNTDNEVEEMYLVRDGKTGRDIWSNERRMDEAANTVNRFIATHGDCDLNSFYSNAGFETLPDGDDWGWSGQFVELAWDEVKRDDGRPVRRFAFRTKPEKGYDRPVR